MAITPNLLEQATRLLDGVPDRGINTLEIVFDDESKTIKIWDMIADNERIVASAEYEEK